VQLGPQPDLDPQTGYVYDTIVAGPKVVLDTNVLVAASRSKRGASAKLISLVGTGHFEISLSVPLVVEYEAVLFRGLALTDPRRRLWGDILDYLCRVGERKQIFFLWRPWVRDPADDMVLELAVAAQCEAIISYNKRDFGHLENFGLEALDPKEFLARLGVIR
jgi:putative PIN family toxin of toxin-antitoxin system